MGFDKKKKDLLEIFRVKINAGKQLQTSFSPGKQGFKPVFPDIVFDLFFLTFFFYNHSENIQKIEKNVFYSLSLLLKRIFFKKQCVGFLQFLVALARKNNFILKRSLLLERIILLERIAFYLKAVALA